MNTETLILLALRFGASTAIALFEAHNNNDVNAALAALKLAKEKTLAEYKAEAAAAYPQ